MQLSVLTTVFLLQLMQLSALTTGNTWNSRWCAHLYFNASLGAVALVRRLIFNLTPQNIWRWLLILRRCVRRQRLFCPVLTWSYAALCFKWPAVMLHEAEYCIEIQDSCSKEYFFANFTLSDLGVPAGTKLSVFLNIVQKGAGGSNPCLNISVADFVKFWGPIGNKKLTYKIDKHQ